MPRVSEEQARELGERISNVCKGQSADKATGSVWTGPCGEGSNGGITFSLLSRWLCCRERFRLLAVQGLKPEDAFNHRIEYGSMWHVCEEYHAGDGSLWGWVRPLRDYCQGLCKRYPLSQEQINHWYNVCKVQFSLYIAHWAKHPDVQSRTPLLQEQVFNVLYQLRSGRAVRLRGKWDSVDLVGEGNNAGLVLQENKTKGDIREGLIQRQLLFDLQTMTYLVALHDEQKRLDDSTIKSRLSYRDGIYRHFYPISGVRYNVIRRPLSGGKGTIIKHKPTKKNPHGESSDSFYQRLSDIIAGDPEHYFMRWFVTVTPDDLLRFERECLDPILEELCDWWEWVKENPDPFVERNKIHSRYPFGVFNLLAEGGGSDLDEYLATGSTVGLRRIDSLFSELE